MSNDDLNGIRIGDDKWIPWIDYDPANEVSIDVQFVPLHDLWDQLETVCVAYCCGLDAFDFTPTNIQRASVELDDPLLPQKLSTLRDQLAASSDIAYDSTRFNCSMHRDVLLHLIDHIAGHVKNC